MTAQTGSAIGAAIKREQDRLGWTGEDVRKASGVDPTSLSMFKLGRRVPRIPVLERLAKAFGVPLAALLGPIAPASSRVRSSDTSPSSRKSTRRGRNKRAAAHSPDISRASRSRRHAQ